MARNNKISMPSSSGGIVRYFDEDKSKIRIKPGTVIILIGVVVVVEILMHTLL